MSELRWIIFVAATTIICRRVFRICAHDRLIVRVRLNIKRERFAIMIFFFLQTPQRVSFWKCSVGPRNGQKHNSPSTLQKSKIPAGISAFPRTVLIPLFRDARRSSETTIITNGIEKRIPRVVFLIYSSVCVVKKSTVRVPKERFHTSWSNSNFFFTPQWDKLRFETQYDDLICYSKYRDSVILPSWRKKSSCNA